MASRSLLHRELQNYCRFPIQPVMALLNISQIYTLSRPISERRVAQAKNYFLLMCSRRIDLTVLNEGVKFFVKSGSRSKTRTYSLMQINTL